MKKFIRILIVDDHKVLREGLVNLLSKDKKLKIIAEANTGLSAVILAKRFKPDVILMDIKLPKLNGIEATKRILNKFKKSPKKPKIIILSMYDDEAHIMESIHVGASGFIVKSCSGDEIITAIHRVVKGEFFIQRNVTNKFLNAIRSVEFESEKTLTPREIEITKLVAEGFSNKEIARIVYSAEKTVKNQLNSVFQKLNAVNRAQAVKEAIRRNIISADLP